MSRPDPLELYEIARRATSPLSGYYNHNVAVDAPDGAVLVRVPLPRADRMDPRIWSEGEVLSAVAEYVDQVPAVRHVSTDPPFQVHELVPGRSLHELAPRGTPVPENVIPGVVRLFAQLAAVPRERLPRLPPSWPADGQCAEFARWLSDFTQRVFDTYRPRFGTLFGALGVPDDPLGPVVDAWPALTARRFRLLHADLHRRNMIVAERGVVFLDWELALWGDPVHDLAVHVHKMSYLPDELRDLLTRCDAVWDAVGPGWRADLPAYLRHERVKAAIVHTVRYAKEIVATGTAPRRRAELVGKLTADLNAARPLWGRDGALTETDVRDAIRRWAQPGAGAAATDG